MSIFRPVPELVRGLIRTPEAPRLLAVPDLEFERSAQSMLAGQPIEIRRVTQNSRQAFEIDIFNVVTCRIERSRCETLLFEFGVGSGGLSQKCDIHGTLTLAERGRT